MFFLNSYFIKIRSTKFSPKIWIQMKTEMDWNDGNDKEDDEDINKGENDW